MKDCPQTLDFSWGEFMVGSKVCLSRPHDAYELDAFKLNLTRTEADIRIAMLTAKLKLLGEPPHTL